MKKKLPCEECGGKCCFFAPIELKAWDRVKHLVKDDAVIDHRWIGTKKEAFIVMKPDSKGECYFLKNGRCSIYPYRPRSCRACGELFDCGYVNPHAMDGMIAQIRAIGHRFVSDDYK